MKKNIFIALAVFAVLAPVLMAQIDARMFQSPDVSETHIVFGYAGDLWIVPKEGGTAMRLSSPRGRESNPRFSPDGKRIAFNAAYDGNLDVFVIPVEGGRPARITNHGMPDRLIDWTPDGGKILFASSMESGKQRFSQFYLVSPEGGLPAKLPVPYGEFASFSPDGGKLVYTPLSQANRTWKRYRGGMGADMWMFDLATLASETIAPSDAAEEFPMCRGDRIYFLSDRGEEKRGNIWVYDIPGKSIRQITRFTEFDVRFPAIGPSDIVFEAGGKLYRLILGDEKVREVPIRVVTDELTLRPRTVNAAGFMNPDGISAPNGKRALIEARGEIFLVPAENGPVINLTQSSGSAERHPAWSPDGRSIAYWSDKSGEYELVVADSENPGSGKTVSSLGPGFRYRIFWSPDGKKIAFLDQKMEIRLLDPAAKTTVLVAKCGNLFHGNLTGYRIGWSPDSRWIAYARDFNGRGGAIFVYDTASARSHQLTSGFYTDSDPVFDPDGKYLCFLTNRTFQPLYSPLDSTWVYANATAIALVPLTEDIPSPLLPKDDFLESAKTGTPEAAKIKPGEKGEKEASKEGKAGPKPVSITTAGFENRIVILPTRSGNIGRLHAVSGKVIYQRAPNTGSESRVRPILFYDLDKREEKTIVDDSSVFEVSADGSKMIVGREKMLSIVDVAEGQKMDKTMPADRLEMTVDPRAEWRQIFNDAWRLERDYFYDPGMHGVDWTVLRGKYGRLIDNAASRWDVGFILGELIGELNASHTYEGGGDAEEAERVGVGYLGVDWELAGGAYRIKRIVEGAPWDTEVRSPLREPGVKIGTGDYILAVNGRPLDVKEAPWGAFAGLAGRTVELTVNGKPEFAGARKVAVKTLPDETRLRNLEWIENNRKKVDEASKGRIGYIYVPSTGVDGQTELYRQYMAQYQKDGLIVDERFNDGGQIPDRFIELLNRKPLAFWATRDGDDWTWPPSGHSGPKAMLINGWSGSGGDAFPDYFRKAGLGPLIGLRTWGGLIGMSGTPELIDGGGVTAPTFRMYNTDGTWFKEGHGVDPDIEVVDDPTLMAKGGDPQLERAVQEVLKMMEMNPPLKARRPPYEKR